MSKIFKASDINIDDRNKFFVEVQQQFNNAQAINTPVEKHGDAAEEDGMTKEEKMLQGAKSEAERIIKKAHVDAERIFLDVKSQCDKLKDETINSAHKQGYDEGYSKGIAEAEGIKAKAQQTLTNAESERETILNEIEPQMVDLIIKITSKLLNDTAQINPQIILNLIKQGLNETTITGDIVIHVSNDDFEFVTANKNVIEDMVGGGTSIEIAKNSTINKSDCIIETQFGNIDCSLDQQFESLKRDIYYIFENR